MPSQKSASRAPLPELYAGCTVLHKRVTSASVCCAAKSHTSNDTSVVIYHNNHRCTLTYVAAQDTIHITRITSQGKQKTLLHIPLNDVLNLETPEERDARQRMRQTNDEMTNLCVNHENGGRGLLCAFPAAEDDEDVLIIHSRVNTLGTLSHGSLQVPLTVNSSRDITTLPHCHAVEATARYFLHYLRRKKKASGRSIHTVEFTVRGGPHHLQAANGLAETILHRVYPAGAKHILAFISPLSGQGFGRKVFEKSIKPVLHFSRHSVHVHITTHAHDCENIVANLENAMDSHYVLVAVGGDGMMHEMVNGLHRRRLALAAMMREASPSSAPDILKESAFTSNSCEASLKSPNTLQPILRQTPSLQAHGRPNPQTVTRAFSMGGWAALMPLAATVPAGSGCGLAKSLGVLGTTQAALALVHLHSFSMDLMNMDFSPNPDLVAYHREQFSDRALRVAEKEYREYRRIHAEELQERELALRAAKDQVASTADGQPTAASLSVGERAGRTARVVDPFLQDGSSVFADPISLKLGAPEFTNRVAFMSLSFGMPNDIDHGSEHLRWMGNSRFTVYGGYLLLRGVRRYPTVLRYLPWESRQGLTVEKIHPRDKMPHRSQLGPCTLTDTCPHCMQYAPPSPHETMHAASDRSNLDSATPGHSELTDSYILQEHSVDFDDPDLPWVTIRGDFFSLLICGMPHIAQDITMAPLSHISDGGMDLVFAREDPETKKGGRKEFLQMFTSMEEGSHVNLWFANYVRARAVEVRVDAGISMSDGEMMPFSSVRLTKLRNGVRMVRATPN